MDDIKTLRSTVFDSLEEQIAVIDGEGVIVDVNAAWKRFGADNGLQSSEGAVGINYLTVLAGAANNGDTLAMEAQEGIRQVLCRQRPRFYLEYPCHSPEQERWFMMSVTPLQGDSQGSAVVSHYDITQRKKAEQRAEHLARHDGLTGLANRRYFDGVLDQEWRRGLRQQQPLSVMMVDVDYFKEYNDALGHLAGDNCLKALAEVMRQRCRRASDLVARFGGDEFAVMLGETNLEEACGIARRVVADVQRLGLVFANARQVTVSIGIASLMPQAAGGETELLEQADRALYQAKAQGRNQLVCGSPSEQKPER